MSNMFEGYALGWVAVVTRRGRCARLRFAGHRRRCEPSAQGHGLWRISGALCAR